MLVYVYLNQYAKLRKIFQILLVDLIEIHIFCYMRLIHFLAPIHDLSTRLKF